MKTQVEIAGLAVGVLLADFRRTSSAGQGQLSAKFAT
jgi:hypothetical protein